MSNLLEVLRSLFSSSTEPSEEELPTVESKEISTDKLVASLEEEIPDWDNGVTRIPMDGSYEAPVSREDVEKALKEYQTEDLEYRKAAFDCENFAMMASGVFARDYGINTVGMAVDWSAENPHAYSVVVYADGSVDWFEPQSDKFITEPWNNDANRYDLNHGRIIV